MTSNHANENAKNVEPLNKGNDQTNSRPDSQCIVTVDRLEFDIFFDGTWNSKENSDWYNNPDDMHGVRTNELRMEKQYNPSLINVFGFKVGGSVSFARAPTGVDQMHRASDTSKPHIIPIYVDGAGTETPESVKDQVHKKYTKDNSFGAGLAYGSTGVFAKLNAMLAQVKEEIGQYNLDQGKNVAQLIFNVYGFSRGAATARMFCNRIMRPSVEIEHENKPKETFDLSKYSISLKMVGLFDTVTSIGGDHLNDVKKDGLGLVFQSPTSADLCINFKKRQVTGKIVHLLAAHEFRQKFAVTNIRHAVENGYGFELALPGCHTDLGDGLGTEGKIDPVTGEWYVRDRNEEKTILQKYRVMSVDASPNLLPSLNPLQVFLPAAKSEGRAKKENSAADFEIVMNKLIEQGWYDNSLMTEIKLDNNLMFEMLKVDRKQISSDYPKIPTHIMIELSKKYGAYHLKQKLLDKYSLDHSADENLKKIYKNLKEQAMALEAITSTESTPPLEESTSTNKPKWVSEIINNSQHHQPYIDVFGEELAVNLPDGKVKTLRKHLYNRYLHWGGEMGRGLIDLTLTQVNVSHIDQTTNEFYRTVIDG